MKKFIITENQLKTIVDKLITEANPGLEEKEINVSNSFTSGQYNLTATTEIDNAIMEITKMFPPGSKIDVTIESSESRVPNRINGVYVPDGTLSKMRGDIVKKYLDGKKLPNFTFTKRDMGVQGPEFIKKDPENPKKYFDNPRDKKYIPYQYVKLKIYASKEKIPDESCLVDLEIYVEYDREKFLKQFPNANEHKCDFAQFTLYANGIPIKNQTNNTYFIDLNNDEDGGNRKNKLVITSEDAKKILAINKEILISVYCAITSTLGCHSDPLLISVKNNQNQGLYGPTFITLGERLQHRQGRNIMRLDSCGNVINANVAKSSDLEDTDSVLPKKDVEDDYSSPRFDLVVDKKQSRRDERENGERYTIESLSQIYRYVENNGKGMLNIPRQILLRTMRGFMGYNLKSWNVFRRLRNVSDKQQVELDNYMVNNNIKFVNGTEPQTQSNSVAKQK
jgi:hypothetical protein